MVKRIIIILLLITFSIGSLFYIPRGKKENVVADKKIEKVKDSRIVLSEAEFKQYLKEKKINLNVPDYFVFIIYVAAIFGVSIFVSRRKDGEIRDPKNYFLANRSLPWWAVGASLIAANISAEQFIGMSGSGFSVGLSVATYEWMSALTLIIVARYFIPIFIREGIYTIPELVEKRYNKDLRTILSIFWLALFIFINLTSVLFLGASAIKTITGWPIPLGVVILACFALAYSIWGGMKAIAWTNVIQVFFLFLGGIFTSFFAISKVGGMREMIAVVPEKFQMILSSSDPNFASLPGIGVLIGGMWVANLYYWGFSQYIIQGSFAAKNLKESRRGVLFAAFLKLVIPFIVVIPGIAAYILWTRGEIPMQVGSSGNIITDTAYPSLLGFLPSGIKGVAFAALIAAIVSTVAAMLNSIATIWTMDIYTQYIKKDVSPQKAVNSGRLFAIISLVIAILIAPQLASLGQAFQFIQEYTGLISPPILAVLLAGIFWKRTTSNSIISGLLFGTAFGLQLKVTVKFAELLRSDTTNIYFFKIFDNFPFMHQMGLTFVLTLFLIFVVSKFDNKKDFTEFDENAFENSNETFKTDKVFNAFAFAIILILCLLYTLFWNTNGINKIFNKEKPQEIVQEVR